MANEQTVEEQQGGEIWSREIMENLSGKQARAKEEDEDIEEFIDASLATNTLVMPTAALEKESLWTRSSTTAMTALSSATTSKGAADDDWDNVDDEDHFRDAFDAHVPGDAAALEEAMPKSQTFQSMLSFQTTAEHEALTSSPHPSQENVPAITDESGHAEDIANSFKDLQTQNNTDELTQMKSDEDLAIDASTTGNTNPTPSISIGVINDSRAPSALTLDHTDGASFNNNMLHRQPPPQPPTTATHPQDRPLQRQHDEDDETTTSSTGLISTGQNTASGQWGWFEDVHSGDAATPTPASHRAAGNTGGPSANATSSSSTTSSEEDVNSSEEGSDRATTAAPRAGGGTNQLTGGRRKRSGKSKKSKTLMLFSDVPAEPLSEILEPPKAEVTSIPVTAPTYVLEESRSSQELWKETAGNRPPQPAEERAFYERMWAQNFSRSQVTYTMPVEVLTATSPISLSPFAADDQYGDGRGEWAAAAVMTAGNAAAAAAAAANGSARTPPVNVHNVSGGVAPTEADFNSRDLNSLGPHQHHHTLVNRRVRGPDGLDDLTVVVRGDNVFGTTVSKSFARAGGRADTVSVSIASYRVVESKKQGKYAQYLVIYCEGTFRDTVGVWKRYSDFNKLAKKVMNAHESCASILAGMHPLSVADDQHEVELLPNAIASWKLLKKRQRWCRCLDAGYLSLKVFLLERFLHDILFESSSPKILRDFVGVNAKTP